MSDEKPLSENLKEFGDARKALHTNQAQRAEEELRGATEEMNEALRAKVERFQHQKMSQKMSLSDRLKAFGITADERALLMRFAGFVLSEEPTVGHRCVEAFLAQTFEAALDAPQTEVVIDHDIKWPPKKGFKPGAVRAVDEANQPMTAREATHPRKAFADIYDPRILPDKYAEVMAVYGAKQAKTVECLGLDRDRRVFVMSCVACGGGFWVSLEFIRDVDVDCVYAPDCHHTINVSELKDAVAPFAPGEEFQSSGKPKFEIGRGYCDWRAFVDSADGVPRLPEGAEYWMLGSHSPIRLTEPPTVCCANMDWSDCDQAAEHHPECPVVIVPQSPVDEWPRMSEGLEAARDAFKAGVASFFDNGV